MIISNIFDTELTFLMTPERRFKQLCQNLTIKLDEVRYPNKIFWFRDGRWIFDYDKENGFFWVNNSLVWSVFESEFEFNYEQIKELIKGRVEEHFKLKNVTPLKIFCCQSFVVEEHFKLKC
jgi:GH35 family endo-1,4-beta-xylanase